MQPRVFRFSTRHPVAGILLVIVVLLILAAILAVSVPLVIGAAVLGGAGLLVRRVRGGRRLSGPRGRIEGTEVFPEARADESRRLRSGDDA